MGRYRLPAGGFEWDDARPGDLIRIERDPITGSAVSRRLPIPADWEDVDYSLKIVGGLPTWVPSGLTPTEFPVLGLMEVPPFSEGAVRDSDGDLVYAVPE